MYTNVYIYIYIIVIGDDHNHSDISINQLMEPNVFSICAMAGQRLDGRQSGAPPG